MVIFLAAALVSFLVFQSAKFLEKEGFPDGIIVYKITEFISIRTNRLGRTSLLSVVIFVSFLVATILFSFLFSNHNFGGGFSRDVLGRYGGSFFLGLIFGALFANWLNGVAREESAKSLSTGQVVYGVLLVVIFVAGSLGQETGRILENYAKSLNKVSIAGVEIGFSDARRGARTSTTENTIVNPAPAALLPPGTSGGLGAISGLADLIERDCRYIAIAMDWQVEECEGREGDSLWSMRQHCQDRRTARECLLSEQRAAKRSAQALLVDYGRCLLATFEHGTDSSFIKQRLEGLAPRLRELASLNFRASVDFRERASMTFFNETLTLLDYVFSAFLDEAAQSSGNRSDRAAVLKKKSFDSIQESCTPLIRLLCSPSDSGSVSLTTCRTQITGNSLNSNFKPDVNSAPLKTISSLFGQMIWIDDYAKRPYVVTAHTYLMSHLRDYDSALFRLYEWIALYGVDTNPVAGSISSSNNLPSTIYTIRARLSILFATEEWLRYLKNDAPSSLREQHLDNITRLINLQVTIPAYRKLIDLSKSSTNTSSQGGFTIARIENKTCVFTEDYKTRLIHNFLSQKLLFAYNAIRHPEYTTKYAPIARAHVLDVVNADLGCVLEKPYGRWGQEILRADAYDLHAQIALREALSTRISKGRSSTLNELGIALNAAKLGRTLVTEAKADDSRTKEKSDSFIEKISITPTYDTYSSIDRTIAAIEQAIVDVTEND